MVFLWFSYDFPIKPPFSYVLGDQIHALPHRWRPCSLRWSRRANGDASGAACASSCQKKVPKRWLHDGSIPWKIWPLKHKPLMVDIWWIIGILDWLMINHNIFGLTYDIYIYIYELMADLWFIIRIYGWLMLNYGFLLVKSMAVWQELNQRGPPSSSEILRLWDAVAAVLYPWRIHDAGIYANINILMGSMAHHNIYIYSSTMDPMGYEKEHFKDGECEREI